MESIDDVREILFGEARRELERRVSRLQSRLTAHCEDLAKIEQQRTTTLEAHVAGELAVLRGRIDTDAAEAREAVRALVRDQREAMQRVEERVAKIEEAVLGSQRELRQQMLEQSRSFFDELARVRRELSFALEDELGPPARGEADAHDDANDALPLSNH